MGPGGEISFLKSRRLDSSMGESYPGVQSRQRTAGFLLRRGGGCMCWGWVLGGDSCSENVENWKGMKDTCSELFSVSLIRHITLGGGNARWKDG